MTAETDSYRVKIGAWVKARLMRDPNALKIDCEGLDLFVVRDVLPPELCTAVIALMDEHLTPSEIMAPHPDPDYRTSYSGNPPREDPLILEVERRIQETIGIQRALGEPLQGQRYAVGQQFKPHWDFFMPNEPYYALEERRGGQRTWTAMAFLNDVEAGGHTKFTEAGVSIRPRAGNLLIWNNMTPEGDLNGRSMHCGTPVEAGVKYIITKWHRERTFQYVPDVAAS